MTTKSDKTKALVYIVKAVGPDLQATILQGISEMDPEAHKQLITPAFDNKDAKKYNELLGPLSDDKD